MAISDKILYLNDTKKLLKQEINKSTEITDEDTFRSYAPKIYDGYLDLLNNGTDTLWNNLEKVSASEETPVLENVETAPIKMELNGNTSQEIIPKDVGKEVIDIDIAITDADIEKENYIELQGNTSQDTTTGKNLVKIVGISNEEEKTKTINGVTFTVNEDGTVKVEGTNNSTSRILQAVTYESAVTGEAGTYYYFANSPSQSKRLEMACFVDEKYEYPNSYGTTPWSKTAATNFTIRNIYFVINAGETVNNVYYVILTRDVNPQPYEPYTGGQLSPSPDYPQEVKVVKGENVVSVSGKNLFDKDNANILNAYFDTYNMPDGSTSTIRSNNNNRILYIPCKSNTTYAIQREVLTSQFGIGSTSILPTIDVDVEKLLHTTGDKYNAIYTTAENANYLVLRYTNRATSTDQDKLETFINTLMITEGSTATPYVPYSKTDYPINLGDIELCKIGNYQDYLYKNNGKWYVHKEIGKVVLNGSENWRQSSVVANVHNIQLNDMLPPTTNAEIYINGISNTFLNGASYNNLTTVTTYMNYYNRMSATYDKYMSFSYEFTTSINDWKNWLSTHNIIAYYVLATPIEEEITDTTLIEQLEALYTARLVNSTAYISTIADNLEPFINLKYNVVIPSPSPERPSEVKVVKGENVVSVSGKNLFNYLGEHTSVPSIEVENISNGNKLIYTGSTELTRARYCSFILLDLRKHIGKTIRAKANIIKSGNNKGLIRLFTSNLSGIGITKASTSTSGNTISFVVPELIDDQIYLGLSLYVNTDGGTAQPNDYVEYTDVIVTIDEENMDYTPYSKTDYPINLASKNKLDLSKIVKGRLDNGVIGYESGTTNLETINNNLTFATNTNYRGVTTDYIEIKNGNFILFDWLSTNNDNLQVFVAYYDKDKNYISQTSGYSLTNAFRFNNNVENSKYIRLYISLVSIGEITIQRPQVEFVSDVSEFEEYFNIELCKINTYKDYFHKDSGKWYVHKEIGKDVFNGSEGWEYSSKSNIPTPRSVILLSSYIDFQSLIYYSNHFTNDDENTSNRLRFYVQQSNYRKDIYLSLDNEIVGISSGDSNATRLQKIKTWLSTHNTIVYYVLATPTEEEITDTTLIEQLEAISKAKSVKDKTYITQTNDELPFILDVEAIKEYEENLDNN